MALSTVNSTLENFQFQRIIDNIEAHTPYLLDTASQPNDNYAIIRNGNTEV